MIGGYLAESLTRLQRRLKPNPKKPMMSAVPLTLEQIVEETRHWPPEKVGELVGRLTQDLHASDPETEAAWKQEIDRRIEEIQTGKVQGIPAEEEFEKAKRILGRRSAPSFILRPVRSILKPSSITLPSVLSWESASTRKSNAWSVKSAVILNGSCAFTHRFSAPSLLSSLTPSFIRTNPTASGS